MVATGVNDTREGHRSALFSRSATGLRKTASYLSAAPPAQVLACIDPDKDGCSLIGHAKLVAGALDLPVAIATVLESPQRPGTPTNPLEWQLRRRECQNKLAQVGAEVGGNLTPESLLLTGRAPDALSTWAQEHPGCLLTLGVSRCAVREGGLGATSQRVLESGTASLLLVPRSDQGFAAYRYRKLLVPLDGSPRAESVLPIAVRMARAFGAELILAHVVPSVELVVPGSPIGNGASDLCERLGRHNATCAKAYLEVLRGQVWREGVSVKAIVACEGDPRDKLRRIAIEENVDLLLLSSHGRTDLDDAPCGSVTYYLATHAPTPLLIVGKDLAIGPGPGEASQLAVTTDEPVA